MLVPQLVQRGEQILVGMLELPCPGIVHGTVDADITLEIFHDIEREAGRENRRGAAQRLWGIRPPGLAFNAADEQCALVIHAGLHQQSAVIEGCHGRHQDFEWRHDRCPVLATIP